MSIAHANRRGILAMVAAMALFTGNDTLVKIATADLPPGEIMAIRGAFAVALVLAMVAGRGEARHLGALRKPIVMLRGALEAVVASLFITSLGHLPIANINAILLAAPIIITALAVALRIEQVGWRRWSAVVVGFLGVLFIVKPSLSGMSPYAALALGAAVFVAVRDLLTRRVGESVPNGVVTLATTVAVALGGTIMGIGEDWRVPDGSQVAVLAGAAVFVALGNLAIVQAMRVGEMSVVSPFRYSIVLTTLFAGLVFFGEWPDLSAFFGMALVVGSGLYTLRREQVRFRESVRARAQVAVAGEPL